jgi:hypothetical protein
MKKEDVRDMIEEAFKSVCISTIVVCPDSLCTPSTSSAIKIRETQRTSLMTVKQQVKKVSKWNIPLISRAAQITGTVTNNYVDKLRSVNVLSGNLEYLTIRHLSHPVQGILTEFSCT